MNKLDRLERAAGPDGNTHEHCCLNCGAALVGDYCSACGQHAHVHRTLAAFFHDLIHGVFHVEGRTWRTLPLLAWRPGELTRRYIEGERASFVSPIALFLFTVFLMFAVVGNLMSAETLNGTKVTRGLDKSIAFDRVALAKLREQRAGIEAAHRPTSEIDAKIQDSQGELKVLETMHDRGFAQGASARLSDDVPDWIGQPIQHAADNPDLALYKLKSSAYKWSWALIPLSVPFLWLMFPFSKRFRLYDHTVFVTYSLSFMSLLVVVLTIWSAVGLPGVGVAFLIIPPFHMYRQLKGAYGLSRWEALPRMIGLVVFSTVVLLLFAMAMFAVGILD